MFEPADNPAELTSPCLADGIETLAQGRWTVAKPLNGTNFDHSASWRTGQRSDGCLSTEVCIYFLPVWATLMKPTEAVPLPDYTEFIKKPIAFHDQAFGRATFVNQRAAIAGLIDRQRQSTCGGSGYADCC
jgi:hypothetical protein